VVKYFSIIKSVKMRFVIRFIAVVSVVVSVVSCKNEVTVTEKSEWSGIFKDYQVNSTFVLKKLSNNNLMVHNTQRADSMYLPASTFKIINSMIALQESAVTSVDDTIKWDGKDRNWKMWNRDHTMRTGMPVSCVWFYQELARRIGKEQMQHWVNQSEYGNMNINQNIDDFWLVGDLRISAKQQITFIENLITNNLPFDNSIEDIVKEIMITDSTDSYTIHSKTGWTENIGWNVGYVETKDGIWIFVMNMDILSRHDLKFRKIITYDILKTEGIIE
jgi:beta-lactamase class D